MSKHTPDTNLHPIERTPAGDPKGSFETLVRQYEARLYTHIQRRVRDTEVAKDLCQETWLKAFRGLSTFRGDSAFSSWLYRIAENVCLDYLRKQKHRDTHVLHLIPEHHIVDTHPCPSRAVERQELREHLRAALAELTPIRRRVFVLYYHHELPIKAIAKRLNRSEGTIKSHLRNARRQLRECLVPYLKNEDSPLLTA